MNDTEQRTAIAEACGCKCNRCNGTGKYLRYDKHTWFRISYSNKDAPRKQPKVPCDHFTHDESLPFARLLPDYLNDLNAMHEAEKVLTEQQQVWYLQKLTQVRFQQGTAGMIACMIDKTTFATARQRAEAFLRTIGKWKDETK